MTRSMLISNIMHALNKLISTEISSARLAWSTLFKIFEALDALSAFTHLIVCFTSSSVMRELNETVRDMNDSAMSLTFAWKDEKKNFSCSISIFFSNVVVIWSMSLHFSDENWESFLNSWLLILVHFAKHHINFVRIMFKVSHRNIDKQRVNQVNENSKLKSEIYWDTKTICIEEREALSLIKSRLTSRTCVSVEDWARS